MDKQQPIAPPYQHRAQPWLAQAAAWCKQLWSDYKLVVLIFLASQVLFYVAIVGTGPVLPLVNQLDKRVEPAHLYTIDAHYRWDAGNYLLLATEGYPTSLQAPNFILLAFFPLLPLLIRIGALPFGGGLFAAGIVGILVSNVITLVAFGLLYRLALDDSDDPALARRAVLYTAIFPLAIFYAVPYTEGLFLALSVAMFLAARRQRWLLAGMIIGFASASRLAGLLLAAPLAVEYALAWRRGHTKPGDWWRIAGALALAPVGLLLFMAYFWQHTGDPLAFNHAQSFWQREQLFPLLTLWRGVMYMLHPSWSSNIQVYAHGLYNTLVVLWFIGVMLIAARHTRPSYLVYGLVVLALALASPLKTGQTMQSTGRYVMILFPVMITMAHWGRLPRVHQLFVIGSGTLFFVMAGLFAHNFWVT